VLLFFQKNCVQALEMEPNFCCQKQVKFCFKILTLHIMKIGVEQPTTSKKISKTTPTKKKTKKLHFQQNVLSFF